jgi:hypothetical protein
LRAVRGQKGWRRLEALNKRERWNFLPDLEDEGLKHKEAMGDGDG